MSADCVLCIVYCVHIALHYTHQHAMLHFTTAILHSTHVLLLFKGC